jgi:enolase
MPIIESISCRNILNSHVEFTNEYEIRLDDGSVGVGASPQGETISIYEDKEISINPAIIIKTVENDGLLHRTIEQAEFDSYLQQHISTLGRNNAYGLSLALFNATTAAHPKFGSETKPAAPRLCCNILNGGWHAYTNPVLSDFPEYLLVAKTNNIAEVIEDHNRIQHAVREKLLKQPKTVVSGNPVSRFDTVDNRECIDFLLNVRDSLALTDKFELMIDASAGDLWAGEGYRLAVTDDSAWSSDAFCDYWLDLIDQYGLRFLEDPFREQDSASWQRLTTTQQDCAVIGDNFYSSDAARIKTGAAGNFSHGVVIKPNQAGTVTAVYQAIETAQRAGQMVITSHRSISTESTFLSGLTCQTGTEYIKIGPLLTDYSSVVRFNEIIRLTEG